jgi:hypothetical protein
MGYGWTDDWATSLSTSQSVPGDICTVGGADTGDQNGFVSGNQPLGQASDVFQFAGNTYIAAADTNRVEEIAGSTGTQWGISMTAGHMYTVAGKPTGTSGDSGNGTAEASTLLDQPQGVAVKASAPLKSRISDRSTFVSGPWSLHSTEVNLLRHPNIVGDTGSSGFVALHSEPHGARTPPRPARSFRPNDAPGVM